MASLYLDCQVACEDDFLAELPSQELLERWAAKAVAIGQQYLQAPSSDDNELTVRIVTSEESQSLNRDFRGKDKPTNVLSFPSERPPGFPETEAWPLLGDLVICASVVASEAAEQQKTLESHWAHMVVHGCLHLLGFDHIEDADAAVMEPLEVNCLAALNLSNPYDV